MTKKKKVFIAINIIVQIIFLSFAIYGFYVGKYTFVVSLGCSSMLTLLCSVNIASDMK